MATWTTITNTALEPGKPIRSVDGLALRDNVTALAEGAAGAPGIASAALIDYPWGNEDIRNSTLGAEKFQTGTTERNWVMERTSNAAGGAVGTYAFLKAITPVGFNDNISASVLTPSDSENNSIGSVSGTWKCMGAVSANNSTEFLRIS